MEELRQPLSVLLAATLASLVSFFLGLRTERASQFRLLFNSKISDFGECLHELLSFATLSDKVLNRKGNYQNYMIQLKEACERLEKLRRSLKYPLWQMDKGVRALVRLHGWLSHNLGEDRAQTRKEIIKRANKIRYQIDKSIFRSFIVGRPPSSWLSCRIILINYHTWRLRKLWASGAESIPD